MSHSDYTRNILNIKDKNIIFDENCLEKIKIGKDTIKAFHAKLTYIPTSCPCCNCLYETDSSTIIKYGFKKNCKVKIDKVCGYKTILILDKQRFLCKNCNNTFTASTSLVDFHKQISNNTKLSITLDLMQKGTEKDIARRNNVSTCSVNRILDNISKDTYVKNGGSLPTVLGIDEFKATADTISKMALIIVDQDNNNIFDIINSRLSKDVEKYFKRYSLKERDKVKFITIDLYKPYYKLFKKLFRKAIIIPDRFHIILQLRNALDQARISLCYKANPNYNKLKHYWKLLLKNENDLTDTKIYSNYFKKLISSKDIVTYLINTNNTLKNTYKLYQAALKALNNKDKEKFFNIINNKKANEDISKKAKKAINTFKKMKNYIGNAFEYTYSNGITEGMNNLIKQIKHAACGYKKFSHLKARVMLIKGLFNPIKSK